MMESMKSIDESRPHLSNWKAKKYWKQSTVSLKACNVVGIVPALNTAIGHYDKRLYPPHSHVTSGTGGKTIKVLRKCAA